MSASVDVTLVRCARLPEPDPDATPLSAALDAAGVSHRWAAWDDPTVDWSASPLTVLRATWNYFTALERFRSWLHRVDAASRLLNPRPLVEWNLHKGYLASLIGAGVPVTPTVYLPQGVQQDLEPLCADKGWARIVVKPAVSAGSYETHFGAPADLRDAARDLNARMDVMVQPFVESVGTYGERSLVWIDGELTHAVLKQPRFTGQVESVTGPHPITPEERAVAQAALAAIPADRGAPMYARVDLVRDAGGAPMVAELELIEPSLFFDLSGEGAPLDRFVAALQRALSEV